MHQDLLPPALTLMIRPWRHQGIPFTERFLASFIKPGNGRSVRLVSGHKYKVEKNGDLVDSNGHLRPNY